tara:strand:- start:170 stop:379 length:210 start_codon:yes stop_codon:yes gene_type:complete
VLTPTVKNGVTLVIVTADPNCDLLALIPHERRAGQKTKGALQVIGIGVGLTSIKVEQCIFVNRFEVLCR